MLVRLSFRLYVYFVIYEYIGHKSAQSAAILLECKVFGIVGIYKLMQPRLRVYARNSIRI